MSKPIFTIVEDDLQEVAKERHGRELTADEIRSAIDYFQDGIPWWETAKCAVDLAIEDHKSDSQPRS